jgi:hypothetical protein
MADLVVGVDFDNTIVNYDRVFHACAVERGLVEPSVGPGKQAIRDHLRAAGREDDWTELQGYVYGPGMEHAEPFEGVLAFFEAARERGWTTYVISHRTLHPYRGPRYDLHESARAWLDARGIGHGLAADMYFETTREGKMDRIAERACTHFIDDLPEFLGDPEFPRGVERLLFAPHGGDSSLRAFSTWSEALGLIA